MKTKVACFILVLLTLPAYGGGQAATLPLRGTVYAADGSPAAGAVVWAAKIAYGPLERIETKADAQGSYELGLGAGDWCVWARRGTQGAEWPALHETVHITPDRVPEADVIRLEERGTVRGCLLEAETGKPIAGGQFFLDAGLILTAGADGRFEVGGLYRGAHEAFVVAPGRVRMRVLFDTTLRAKTDLDVPVPVSGKIVGHVTDLDGKPIAGAYVGRHTSGSFFSLNGLFAVCDAKGRFDYDAAPPDQPTWLSAGAPGFEEELRDGLLVPAGGKPLEIHFRLRATAKVVADQMRRTIRGVVSGPDGKPAAGVLVRWGYYPDHKAIETRSDKAGRYRINVPDEAGVLTVLPRDCLPQFLPVAIAGERMIDVKLLAGGSASGQVVDEAGKPIQGVRVIAMAASPDKQFANPYWLTEAQVRTDAAGNFEVKGVPKGARFDFLKPGLSDKRNVELNPGKAKNKVTLLYKGAIYGRALDQGGQPLRNFRVLVDFPRQRKAGDETAGFFAGYSGMGVRFTAEDGRFVLTGVGAGSVYRIVVLAEGHGEAVLDRVLAVSANRLANVEPVTLRAGAPTALRVRAMTGKNKPIASARVTLVNGAPQLDQSFAWGYNDASWENMARGRSAANGWADFPALGFASATVLVQAPGFARSRMGWRNGEKELTVELVPEAVITGEVTDAAGLPRSVFYVNLVSGGEQISAAVHADGKGRFRVGELPAGEWRIVIRGGDRGKMLHEDTLTLKAGETKKLVIKVN